MMTGQKNILFLLTFNLFVFCQTVISKPSITFEGYSDTWNKASFEVLETEKRQYYLDLIMHEINKYPDEYFNKINLKTIVIVRNLKFDGIYRAAVPDNNKATIFIGIRSDYTDEYVKHVYHHEQNHYAEFSIWKDYRYDWDKWRFLYNGKGGGGELAYKNGDNNAMVFNPKLEGFLNTYSTLGQEEDRSEMIAYFLTDNENKLFIEKANSTLTH